MNRVILSSALMTILSFGCGGDEAPEPETETATEAEASPEAAATTEVEATADTDAEELADEPTAEEIPIAEDFEEEVAAEITNENYRAQLEALAAEIEADENDG